VGKELCRTTFDVHVVNCVYVYNYHLDFLQRWNRGNEKCNLLISLLAITIYINNVYSPFA